MLNREQEVLQMTVGIVTKELMPSRIFLYGSRASGKHRPGSDFELAVDASKPPFRKEREEPSFRELILSTGKLIYENAA